MKGLLGKKLGMTRVYDKDGTVIPVTVVEAGPCTILAVRTQQRDGYSAVQLGFGSRKLKNVTKAMRGHLAKANLTDSAPSYIREIRLDQDAAEQVGQVLAADTFAEGEIVDVIGTSKGKGFAGVVRRHHFAGGRASHGGGWTRRGGSNGMKEHPAEVPKGRRMAGHLGNERCTVQNLTVVQVRKDDNVLLIKGAVPGPNGRYVIVQQSKKKGGKQ
jgi:large subunit ribosomal protein L3